MDRNKVLELAREAWNERGFTPTWIADQLERFAALIEREVRGDAEPVAWCWMRDGLPTAPPYYGKGPHQAMIESLAKQEPPVTVRYFYDHPAPDVVRQLVDGLAGLIDFIEIDSLRIDQDAFRIARAALAAAKENGL